MPDDTTAGVAATDAASDQKSDEVSSQEKSAPDESSNLSEEAKTQKDKSESPDEDGAKEKEKSPKEKLRFDQHPGWKRRERKMAKQNTQLESQKTQITEMKDLMKEMIAAQKGEEFKPEEKTEDTVPGGDELLDMEMDKLLDETELSPEDEAEVIAISKRFETDLGDGNKVFLSPHIALQFMKELKEASQEEDVDTKPSKGVAESAVAKTAGNLPKPRSVEEAFAQAKRIIAASSK